MNAEARVGADEKLAHTRCGALSSLNPRWPAGSMGSGLTEKPTGFRRVGYHARSIGGCRSCR